MNQNQIKDIIPYTSEEAQKLGEALHDFGVPSFGPATGMQLLNVVEGIDAAMKKLPRGREIGTPSEQEAYLMRQVLASYRARILDITVVTAHQQRCVIDTFEKLVKGRT